MRKNVDIKHYQEKVSENKIIAFPEEVSVMNIPNADELKLCSVSHSESS